MNTSFTPGQWKLVADPCHYDTLSSIIAGERRDTGKRQGAPSWQMQVEVGGFADFREQEANARLIAAAPVLLESLQEAAQWMRVSVRRMAKENPNDLFASRTLARFEAAINLATGQEP